LPKQTTAEIDGALLFVRKSLRSTTGEAVPQRFSVF